MTSVFTREHGDFGEALNSGQLGVLERAYLFHGATDQRILLVFDRGGYKTRITFRPPFWWDADFWKSSGYSSSRYAHIERLGLNEGSETQIPIVGKSGVAILDNGAEGIQGWLLENCARYEGGTFYFEGEST